MSPNIYSGLYVDKLSTSYMPAIVDNIGIVDCNVKVLSCVLCTKISGELDSAIISCSKQIFHRRIVSIFRVNVFVLCPRRMCTAPCIVRGLLVSVHYSPAATTITTYSPHCRRRVSPRPPPGERGAHLWWELSMVPAAGDTRQLTAARRAMATARWSRWWWRHSSRWWWPSWWRPPSPCTTTLRRRGGGTWTTGESCVDRKFSLFS